MGLKTRLNYFCGGPISLVLESSLKKCTWKYILPWINTVFFHLSFPLLKADFMCCMWNFIHGLLSWAPWPEFNRGKSPVVTYSWFEIVYCWLLKWLISHRHLLTNSAFLERGFPVCDWKEGSLWENDFSAHMHFLVKVYLLSFFFAPYVRIQKNTFCMVREKLF